ncbi:MAG: 30S ribosomal protein S6 [Candidatus Marinimicrobia bacterium]|nr:30S ribosomal protein S6 [Candidatus Neomarinimicrobiota bacterium]
MRYYEMLFIVHPNYEQDRLEAVIDTVKKEITGKGGKILKADNWGKRKLAYLINKQRYGSYVLMYFETEPARIDDISTWMEIQHQILHQMIIRLDEAPRLSENSENPDSIGTSSYAGNRRTEPVKKADEKEDAGKEKRSEKESEEK